MAFVVRQPGSDVAADELLRWVHPRVGKTQRVASLEVIAELPRSAIGKALKRELRARQVEGKQCDPRRSLRLTM